ncbi:hypothetical protein OEZ86_008091 [Tetradesmus obliquus]|nr:hypothetical protein OEZ86_008091 [Tetradesmus obliquus]
MATTGATTAALLGAAWVLLLAGVFATAATPQTLKYLGCFYNTDYRALSTALNPAGISNVTIGECQALAAAATPVKPLFGVSSGQCYGGTRLLLATSVGSVQDSACADGSISESIGIYQLVPPGGPTPLGCLTDETALPGRVPVEGAGGAAYAQAKATAALRKAKYFAVARSVTATSGYGYTFDAEPLVAPVLNFTINGSLGCYAPCADDAAKACGSADGYGGATLPRVWFVYEVPPCTTLDACGPACVKCPTYTYGTPTCEPETAGGYLCGVKCNTNFKAVTVGGNLTCVPRFSTGLELEDEDRVRNPRNCTKPGPRCTTRNPNPNLGSPLSVKELAQRACGRDDVNEPDCIEGLWLMILPDSYNSNSTADTPGGNRLVRPAQDQKSCGSCAAFAATAAAEAAIAAYMNWNWPRISLSEQDLSFCRLSPTVSCTFGTSYSKILSNMAYQNVSITKWASRNCSQYTGIAPEYDECTVYDKRCRSAIPGNARLLRVGSGTQLDTVARVKRQIILNGGAMATVEIPTEMYTYPNTSQVWGDIYTDPSAGQSQPGSGHALFCYGWKDLSNSTDAALALSIIGYWLCKNSWGTGWGLGGNVKLAYYAAGFLNRYPAYGLQFRPDSSVRKDAVTSKLKQGLSYGKQNSSCLLFKSQQPMRLVKLIDDLYSLAFEAWNAGNPTLLALEVILGGVVAANLGPASLSAASRGPFKLCGQTYDMVTAFVPLPPRPVICDDVPYSTTAANGSCVCSKTPYSVPAMQDVRTVYSRSPACNNTGRNRDCMFSNLSPGPPRGFFLSSINYLDKVLGCVSNTARRCPEGYVGFMSPSAAGSRDFRLELCTRAPACYIPGKNRTVEPAMFSDYGTAGYDAGQLVACLKLDGDACPAQFPQKVSQTMCST